VREITLMWDGEVRATDDALEAAALLQGLASACA
jgi:hypothetical protein